MNIQTLSLALLFTGMALLAERLPMPDTTRLARAADAWAADAGAGVHTLGWEADRAWAHVEGAWADLDLAGPADPGPLGAAAVALLLGLIGITVSRGRTTRTQTVGAAPRLAATRPQTRRRLPARHTPRPSVDRRLARAQSLARKGGPSLDVARRTTLSRDAVELMARIHAPDGIAGGGRSFRGAVA